MIPGDDWDPDEAAEGEGLFGLPHTPDEARVQVLPVPFEATVSYGAGTASAPDRVRRASWQVDLHGGPWREGVALLPELPDVAAWNEAAGAAVARARENPDDADAIAIVDRCGQAVHDAVEAETGRILDEGAIPAVLGGDHSTPVGAVHAAAARHPGLGLLHIDAHADLRDAYEGFTHSHASAVRNMLRADVGRVVSVGLRDVGRAEREFAATEPRVTWFEDQALAERTWQRGWAGVCEDIVAGLPPDLWITFDVDGLDPSLCPATGTPVPGGLRWREVLGLIAAVRRSRRRIVGFDVVEVGDAEWDANVGARLLWALAGCAVASQPR